jgi:hypothetical protein
MSLSSAGDMDSAEAGVERMELGTGDSSNDKAVASKSDGNTGFAFDFDIPGSSKDKAANVANSNSDGDDSDADDDDGGADSDMPELFEHGETAGDGDNKDDGSDISINYESSNPANGTADADMILLKATSLKDLGNTHFSKKELDDAARCYRRGASTLKKLNKNNAGDVQVKDKQDKKVSHEL